MPPSHAVLIATLAPAMRAAGELIERIRIAGFATETKADRSPVTAADQEAEALLMAAIAAADPGTLIVGEEACAAAGVPEARPRFWLIDPLDGTRAFVGGGDDYSVNVGLIEDGRPALGLLLAPRTRMLWAGAAGAGAWREDGAGRRAIATRRPPANPPVALVSHLHRDRVTDRWLTAAKITQMRPSSSSLKFVALAEGSADLYPRSTPTSEWDTAAGHAILVAAGGAVAGGDGAPLGYGKPGCRNAAFLAVGDPALLATLPPIAGGD